MDRQSDNRIVFCVYKNDDDQQVQGYFKLVEQTANYIKILSGKNLLLIPFHRLIKMKESLE